MERVHIVSHSQCRCKEEISRKWVFGGLKKKVTSGLVKCFSELNITASTEYSVQSLLEEIFSYLYGLVNKYNKNTMTIH